MLPARTKGTDEQGRKYIRTYLDVEIALIVFGAIRYSTNVSWSTYENKRLLIIGVLEMVHRSRALNSPR